MVPPTSQGVSEGETCCFSLRTLACRLVTDSMPPGGTRAKRKFDSPYRPLTAWGAGYGTVPIIKGFFGHNALPMKKLY